MLYHYNQRFLASSTSSTATLNIRASIVGKSYMHNNIFFALVNGMVIKVNEPKVILYYRIETTSKSNGLSHSKSSQRIQKKSKRLHYENLNEIYSIYETCLQHWNNIVKITILTLINL